MKRKKKAVNAAPVPAAAEPPKEFLDLIAPGAVKFSESTYVLGSTYRCAWAIRTYPASTEELALLRRLGEHGGVTLHIYVRLVTLAEEHAILQAAANRERMYRGGRDYRQAVAAEGNLQDVHTLTAKSQRDREPLLHCAVFLELAAASPEGLKLLQSEIQTELTRSKLGVDHLLLRQLDGFHSANPAGHNAFLTEYERVLPASSVANLFPLHFSGKTDPSGFYLGRDKYGSNIIVDFDLRADDKTNASILILGNSGQGKSYLLKFLICDLLEAGKSVLSLDTEHELADLAKNLGGTFIDLLSGQYRINLLEPKAWSDEGGETDPDAPAAFQGGTKLSQHISFLRDIFRCYKDFDDQHIDVLELMLSRLYRQWGISDETDLARMVPTDFPILSDLYDCIEKAYEGFDGESGQLYPREYLRDLLLGLHSMCKGADARFFNGHTNIGSARFLVFGVKGLDSVAKNLRSTLLFNLLSFFSDRLLIAGNTVAALDELYLWLDDPVTVTYIRNCLKRVRKKESALILASQNLEDFDRPGIRELTRPLFAIPTHQFLFNAGTVDKRFYMDNLQLEPSEYELIRYPQKGVCLFKCGNERYLLAVKVPPYKEALFGKAGGR